MATITSPRSESPAIGLSRITSPTMASASVTPTSSVRPSLDIPRTNTPSPAPQQHAFASASTSTTSHRRNRAALRDYYNLKGRGASGAGAAHAQDHNLSRTASMASNASASTVTSIVPSAEPSELLSSAPSSLTARLDDPDFEAESYVSDLLKTAGLRDILRTESTLVSEIRNLDGERKALVYDNYSKLIKAVGTIAEMQKGMHKREQDRFGTLETGVGITIQVQKEQTQTPGLDGVEKLAEKLDGLLNLVRDLAPTTTTDPDRSRQLLEARKQTRQKEMVKWALAAPSRLQAMLEHGHQDQAHKEYKSVVGLLDQWEGVGGVHELRARCDKVIEPAAVQTETGLERARRDDVDDPS
ncbi:hypothetical protein A1O3_03044 [Capronia epimyces CBS 606.96]|uniref:Vacuolar protein sorting-associated protein 51 homolog n=1 Tax=Capronia epimyces CBS 606.96 TaxID=1182542 RepID=W9YAV4_9EURO|nr:uncharacterized protein A1O3_03044 [Capronia epimyces CBS 606.96]EXJ89977.1 hypothetical protein A1O3_03044 [Capronia epimyces CBS 606.96]